MVLRGRYPSAANLGEIDPTDTPLFAHVDQSKAELFSSDYEIYTVESDPLLLITDAQPVLVNTRLIVDGSEASHHGISRYEQDSTIYTRALILLVNKWPAVLHRCAL